MLSESTCLSFPPVMDNGHVIANVRNELASKIGARNQWPFVLVASHDTASAVAAISGRPSADRHSTAFVSSGTWSLVGVELDAPIVTRDALAAGFTNEAGLGRTTLFMRNLTGLWLLEQAMRQWHGQGKSVTIASLLQDAATANPLRSSLRRQLFGPRLQRRRLTGGADAMHVHRHGAP